MMQDIHSTVTFTRTDADRLESLRISLRIVRKANRNVGMRKNSFRVSKYRVNSTKRLTRYFITNNKKRMSYYFGI